MLKRNGNTSGKSNKEIHDEVMGGLLATVVAVGLTIGLFVPLFAGIIMLLAGDYPTAMVLLLFAGFVLCLLLALFNKHIRSQLVVLGISLLAIMGIIWGIFEDGLLGKAFMLLLVITAGAMAAWGIYNVFLKKRRHYIRG